MPIRQQLYASFRAKSTTPNFLVHCMLFACLALALWPITQWVAASVNDQSRILHALIVISFASVFLIRYSQIEIVKPFSLNRSSRNMLLAAFGLLFINFLAQQLFHLFSKTAQSHLAFAISLLSIPAYCAAIAAGSLFVFGEGARRLTRTVTGTLCVFLLLSLFMQPLDWPLRTLAGKWSGAALAMIGNSVEIGLLDNAGGPPQLIMLVNEQPFHVAAECNGFGVIITSLLIACMLAIYRKLGPINTALNLLAGITLGFIFNTLRISIIVLLAPRMMDHYHLMHEIVGTCTYWGCLVLAWILMHGPVNLDLEVKN
jgi:exosortase/archaeosortase family protein